MACVDGIVNENNTNGEWVDNIINENETNGEDSWTWPPVEPGKLNCILCRKVITFSHGSTNEFFQHIEIKHKIFINHGLLLSIIFLDSETLDEIRERFKNALNVTGSAGLEEAFVGDGKDAYVCEGDSFDDNGDGFDEDKRFHDFTQVFDQNEKETSFMRKKDFCNKQIKGNEVLENIKYKPGPRSYKIKQLLKNKHGSILSNLNNEILLKESDKSADLKKKVKENKNKCASPNENSKGQFTMKEKLHSNENLQALKSDTNNDRESDLSQHILPTKPLNNCEIITKNKTLVPPNSKLSKIVKLNKAETVEAKIVEIGMMESPDQKVTTKKTFKPLKRDYIPYKPGTKSRKNRQKLNIKEVNDEISKIQKEIEDDLNCLNDFVDSDLSKVEDLCTTGSKRKSHGSEFTDSYEVKRQNLSEPNPYSASRMIDEIKQMLLKDYAFEGNVDSDTDMQDESKADYNLPLPTEIMNISIETSERVVKSNVKEQIKSLFENQIDNQIDSLYNQIDRLSSNSENVAKSPYLEDINSKKPNLKSEEIDSKHINVEISEYFKKRPNQLSGYNISEIVKNQFVFDESLPHGWQIRKVFRETKKAYDTDYLSPDGRKARSKVAVIEYMKLLGNYSPEDYDKIIPNYELNLYKVFT